MTSQSVLERCGIIIKQEYPLVHRWQRENGDRTSEWMHFNNHRYPLEAAVRQQEHILRKYGITAGVDGKIQELEAVIDIIDRIRYQIRNRKASLHSIEAIRSDIDHLQDRLSKVVNERKAEAREQIAASDTLHDSRGRWNPGAISARLTAAANLLAERLAGEIEEAIVPLIVFRHQILTYERDWLRSRVFEKTSRELSRLRELDEWHRGELGLVVQKLQRVNNNLSRPHVAWYPYTDFKRAMMRHGIDAVHRLKNGNKIEGGRRIYLATRLANKAGDLLRLEPAEIQRQFEREKDAE